MFKKFTIAALIALFVSFGINAGEPKGSHASSEWQIWAYTTSAPSFIGNFATVIGGDGSVIEKEQMDGGVRPLCQCLMEASRCLMMPRLLVLIKTQWHGLLPIKLSLIHI